MVVFLTETLITFAVAGGLSMLMERFRSLRVFTGLLLFYGISEGLIRPILATDARWVYPVLFIPKSQAVGLLPILFWNILGDLFTTQQSKRLCTLVVVVGVLGTSVGSVATRPMATWLGKDNLLLVFAVGMGLAATLNPYTEKVTGAPIQPHGKKPGIEPRAKRYAEVFTAAAPSTRRSAPLIKSAKPAASRIVAIMSSLFWAHRSDFQPNRLVTLEPEPFFRDVPLSG